MEFLKSDQANLVSDKNSPRMTSPTWTCINVSSKLASNESVLLRDSEKEIFRHGHINLRHEAKLQQCKFNVNRTSFPPSNTPRIRIQISSSLGQTDGLHSSPPPPPLFLSLDACLLSEIITSLDFARIKESKVLRGQQARRKILEKWKLRLRQPRCHDIKAFWISSESQTQTRSISSCGEAKSKSFFLEDFHLCRSRLDKDLKLCVKCKCNFCNQVIVIEQSLIQRIRIIRLLIWKNNAKSMKKRTI